MPHEESAGPWVFQHRKGTLYWSVESKRRSTEKSAFCEWLVKIHNERYEPWKVRTNWPYHELHTSNNTNKWPYNKVHVVSLRASRTSRSPGLHTLSSNNEGNIEAYKTWSETHIRKQSFDCIQRWERTEEDTLNYASNDMRKKIPNHALLVCAKLHSPWVDSRLRHLSMYYIRGKHA